MPVFDYVCGKCKNEYDVFYTSHAAVVKEEDKETCPKCGSKRKKRLISKQVSHILKGKWFKQGY